MAKAYFECYQAAKVGSTQRAKMLAEVLDLLRIKAQVYGDRGEGDDLSDDDIRAVVLDEVRRAESGK